MARLIPSLVFGAGIACAGAAALAQENSFGPPEALQFPVQAGDSAPNAVTGPFLRAAYLTGTVIPLDGGFLRSV